MGFSKSRRFMPTGWSELGVDHMASERPLVRLGQGLAVWSTGQSLEAVMGLPRFHGRSVDLFGLGRPSAGLRAVVAPFVVDGGTVAEARVQAQRVVKLPT